jgi:hypothetical protein|tara:strand:+ start:2511 stop:3146 length:636 start_codon:yes stop_codon:yes gene_type:complete
MPRFTDNNPLVVEESKTLPLRENTRSLGQSRKSPFGESQSRAAGFTGRMIFSNSRMDDLEESGFNPVNMIDVAKDNLPLVPEFVERMLMSTKYQLYNTNKINFSTAQLRRETGAVINDSEIVWINETYFPQLGEPQEVHDLKRLARKEAIKAMETEAGSAYEGMSQEESQKKASSDARRRALVILRRRAETNPELADQIRAIMTRVRKNNG